MLHVIREPNELKGYRTVHRHLKVLAPISTNTCIHICQILQKLFANWTATSYASYLEILNEDVHVSGVRATLWGKYVSEDFIRSDKRGVKYASNLFSMQVLLAYLSQSRAKIALINDIQSPSSYQMIDRYTCLLEGDGQGGFNPLSTQELHKLQITSQDEPVIIFGGCIYSDSIDKDSLTFKMQSWVEKLPQLILACDVFYPQFFKVGEDSEFDGTPITPREEILKELMEAYSTYGTHPKNPSLYCCTHIHPASIKQVLKAANNQEVNSLPTFFIPQVQLQT